MTDRHQTLRPTYLVFGVLARFTALPLGEAVDFGFFMVVEVDFFWVVTGKGFADVFEETMVNYTIMSRPFLLRRFDRHFIKFAARNG